MDHDIEEDYLSLPQKPINEVKTVLVTVLEEELKQSGEQDRLTIELLSLSFKPPLLCQHWEMANTVQQFSHSWRGAGRGNTRGTLRLREGDRKCSFLFAPGSCLGFLSNGLHSSTIIQKQQLVRVCSFLNTPRARCMVPTQRCQP